MSEGPVVIRGRWRLLKLLGEGKTGKVWQARDTADNTRVAVKILHHQLARYEPEVKRFEREFDILRRIDNPNVVRALDFGLGDGVLEGQHYLVMEYVEGRRLSDVLDAGGLDVDRAAHVALGVARALEAAHTHDVVHRDIEPSNVVLVRTPRGEQVKVLDFGVARLQNGDDSLTEAGVKLGTAEYMSPEYVEDGELDARSDLYALGVLLYALLTGQPPFVGPTLKTMQDHVATQVPPPSLRTPGLPMWLEVLTMRLLAKEPSARPQHASEVVEEIESHLGELDKDATDARDRLASLPPNPMEVAPSASVGHHSESVVPVYADPKPIPKLPFAIAFALGGLAVFGFSAVVAVFAILVLW